VSAGSRPPWLTAGVLGLTAIVSVVGLLDQQVLHHLERHGGELRDGEPWCLVSSLLVHDTWLALLFNLLLLALVGVAVERCHPRVEWVVLYLAGGLVGELVGLSWQPHGAGNSVAAFGIAGALVVDAVWLRETSLVALGYATVVMLTLLAGDVGGAAGSVLLVVVWIATGATIAATRQGRRAPSFAAPGLGALALVVAAVLVGVGDIHGPALFTGAAIAAVWEAPRVRARGGGRIAPRQPRG
jgi:membrane associated rhomboid family serine protease